MSATQAQTLERPIRRSDPTRAFRWSAASSRSLSGPSRRRRSDMPIGVLIVSGIWPPDVGGPATHGPDIARFLMDRGDRVRAVTTAVEPPPPERFPVRSLPRDVPLVRRMVEGTAAIRSSSSESQVIYSIGMYARSAAVTRMTGVPLVLKLANDPAFERARS